MSSNNSGQKFIARMRNRPRSGCVQIEYDLHNTYFFQKEELPFVMGVMADLAGDPAEALAEVKDRNFLAIDIDNFDSRMKAMKPRAAFRVPNTLSDEGGEIPVDLTFEKMDDFSPAAVARKVAPLRKLLEARTQLKNLLSYFTALLEKEFRPKTDPAREAVQLAVKTLAEQALEGAVITEDVVGTIEGMIAALDRKLSAQVNQILHHPNFQQLEGAWRGLHHLVTNTETDEMLKIRVMNISKKELQETLKRFPGVAWDQSPIFKKVYEEEYGQFGGAPYGCLIGDYYFDHGPQDVELLRSMSKIGAAAHAPFISAASPTLMNMDSWQELSDPRDLTKVFGPAEYAAWRSLRESEDSRYLGLCLPRFLARLPYGAKTDPVDEFDFEEETEGGEHSRYTWANSAYAMGVNINRAFKFYGWTTQIRGIESGGAVEYLPTHTFPTDDGGVDMKCPTEIAITDRREKELADNGFMPLVHKKNTDFAAFIGAQSLQKPAEYDDRDATANARLSARLPYLFATCRFAHYLKCIVRDKIGTFKERDDMQRWLSNWIANYVHGDPANATDEAKARRPLAAAQVVVENVEDDPHYYRAQLFLRPHYQFDTPLSIRLVLRLPREF